MSNHKTVFGKLFGWIGDIFHTSVSKLWDSLTPEEQASLKNGSGIINVINLHLSEVPEVVKAAIITEFPTIDISALETTLLSLCGTLNITPPSLDLTGAIAAIQTYLNSKTGTTWQWASSALSELLSVAFAPGQTIFAKISTLIEYTYQTFIKKP